ncbi:MAG: LPS translocon maturation chaperone LptM [Nitrincola lacisaponensis]|uniref:Lipoprotein n=1 Tax=Nitrincola lacisaponensis TaxID=267850 RepID=A0A063Y6R5_9GAMM|nr:lipoprotein [Nitrincola lacisaponensis]KDE40122.1 hypothetical protein ADINL_0714 [Nitrincola lacisaponensis]
MRLVWSVVFASLLLLSGCGQKGPLYLPDQPDVATQQGE